MKVKLRYVTERQYAKWKNKNCDKYDDCKGCLFCKIDCIFGNTCWVNNKDMYSDKFLDQEIEINVEDEKIQLTEDEKAVLRLLVPKYKYIARDISGNLYGYKDKPIKMCSVWYVTNCLYDSMCVFNNYFQCVQWEDNEPTLIADLLRENKDEKK